MRASARSPSAAISSEHVLAHLQHDPSRALFAARLRILASRAGRSAAVARRRQHHRLRHYQRRGRRRHRAFIKGPNFSLITSSQHDSDDGWSSLEELPLASETLYSTTGKGKKKVTTATNEGVAEDNGFLTSLDISLNGHVTLSGFYNRSLRNKIDTAGFSFTFLLKAPPKSVEH